MFLTKEEVAELTGYKKPSAQIKWFQVQQIGLAVGGDGHPKALRQTVINRLAGQTAKKKSPALRLK
ncbi:DUF4224 domain-containing protein [Pseudomonas sp. LB3P93]